MREPSGMHETVRKDREFRAIVTFHSIDSSGSVLSYPARRLASLLEALERCGIPVVDLDTLLHPKNRCGVALTFDDGMRSVLTAALPILQAHSVPSHLFLTTSVVGRTNEWPGQPSFAPIFPMLRWSELETLQATGMRIECHTITHPDLRSLDESALLEELQGADDAIKVNLGRSPTYFAYPYGYSNAHVRALARARYRACLTAELRTLRRAEDAAALPRLDSYYLQTDWIIKDLRSLPSRAYLNMRRLFRRLRSLR